MNISKYTNGTVWLRNAPAGAVTRERLKVYANTAG